MLVTLKKEQLKNNLQEIKSRNSNVVFLIKRQLLFDDLCETLKDEKVYSTGSDQYENIYNSKDCVVVDAFDNREGITLDEAKTYNKKKTAIVNFACCNGLLPTAQEVNEIYDKLKSYGWEKVSMGGSLMLWYENIKADEIRVGETFLTGYHTMYNEYYMNCKNPFEVLVDIHKENKNNWIINTGFQYFSGFTNCSPECVNTDFTVISKKHKIKVGNKLRLEPDYYTLMKLAFNGYIR